MRREAYVDPRELKSSFNSKRFIENDYEKNRPRKSGKKRLEPYKRNKLSW